MKDNRIFRPEQMNEKDVKVMNEALDSFYKKHYNKKSDEEREAEMAENPNLIKIDGKWYDKRYYKGGEENGQ